MYCVGITMAYTLKLPLSILPLLAADFDGDVLNILYLINKDFIKQAERIFNPRNAMYVSRNDGKVNMDVLHTKDLLINLNSLLYMARPNYTQQQKDQILQVKAMPDIA